MQNVALILLGIVAETPRYAHEIQQVITHRQLRRWVDIGEASVFYVLEQLEKEKLIRAELPFEEVRSARTRYLATDAGRAILKTAALDRITRAAAGVGDFEVGLLLSGHLPPTAVQEALYERRIELARRIEQFSQALNEPQSAGLNVTVALYRRNIALLEADLDWLSTFEDAWQQEQDRQSHVTKTDPSISLERLRKLRGLSAGDEGTP